MKIEKPDVYHTIFGEWDDVTDEQVMIYRNPEEGDRCLVFIMSGCDYGGGISSYFYASWIMIRNLLHISGGDPGRFKRILEDMHAIRNAHNDEIPLLSRRWDNIVVGSTVLLVCETCRHHRCRKWEAEDLKFRTVEEIGCSSHFGDVRIAHTIGPDQKEQRRGPKYCPLRQLVLID